MRLIDADTLKESVIRWLPQDPCGIAEKERPFETDICVSMLMEIEEAPTVDAVEVVRCKDCKLFKTASCAIKIDTEEEMYCGYAERRQE